MLDWLALAGTAPIETLPTVPGTDVPYPWGKSGADEMLVIAMWDLGRRWLRRHYDAEREGYIAALQDE